MREEKCRASLVDKEMWEASGKVWAESLQTLHFEDSGESPRELIEAHDLMKPALELPFLLTSTPRAVENPLSRRSAICAATSPLNTQCHFSLRGNRRPSNLISTFASDVREKDFGATNLELLLLLLGLLW